MVTSEGGSRNIPASAVGGGETLLVNIINDDQYNILDKTFGEIRGVFENGGTVIIVDDTSYDNYTERTYCYISALGYEFEEHVEGYCTITEIGGRQFNAYLTQEPYTLEALDALYLLAGK